MKPFSNTAVAIGDFTAIIIDAIKMLSLSNSETNNVLFQVLMVVNTEITLSWECSIHMDISKDFATPVFRAGQYLPNYNLKKLSYTE